MLCSSHVISLYSGRAIGVGNDNNAHRLRLRVAGNSSGASALVREVPITKSKGAAIVNSAAAPITKTGEFP